MHHEISISVADYGARSVVHVTGDVNWRTSPEVRTALLDLFENRHRQGVVLDLQGVRRIDSSGVSSLIEARHAAKQQESHFVLSGLNEFPRRVLAYTGLQGLFEIGASVEEALGRCECPVPGKS